MSISGKHDNSSENTGNTDLKIIKFRHLNTFTNIRHGIFSRLGGYSKKPFDSLNTGLSVGDNKENVLKNRQKIIDILGGGVPVFINQVHGKVIFVLKKNKINSTKNSGDFFCDNRKPDMIPSFLSTPPDADGIITDIPELLLFIQVADCQPIMLYDPLNNVIANIHSGWKGSIKNIVGKGINTMRREFGSDPADILAGIGPSLGPCCSEFINYKSEIPEKFSTYKQDNNYFDFWRMTIDQLTAKGIKRENIELSGICTKCSHNSFFSYRYEKITGRFASVIGIR